MAYTEGQIDRIRSRLCAYRAQQGDGGRARPWKAVLNDILMSEETVHNYPEDGSNPEFKEEALRRFASGTSLPSQDKLEDIQTLLVEARFLSHEALTDGVWDYAIALSLRSLFGEATRGKDLLKAFSGDYRSEIAVKKGELEGTARYDLSIKPVEDEGMMRLRQSWFKWLYGDVAEMETQRKYDDQIRSQNGFGFPADSGEVTLFFKDGLTGKMDILTLTDMAVYDGENSVDWFFAAKVNQTIQPAHKMPEGNINSLTLEKHHYQNRASLEKGGSDGDR
ncbi:MAG: hypothetical protein JKY34_03015 [Kordiimonadaceae bacterium]|nr:hypothetical protein [Kordiimonadaceae bacterium]